MELSKTWCCHMASLSSDAIVFPKPDTPCKRCQYPSGNWFCLYCKDILCGSNSHMSEHYELTDHCLAISCSDRLPFVWCYSCKATADVHQVIRRLQEFSSSPKEKSSLKLEKLDAMMVDVADLISKPFPGFNNNPVDAKPFDGHDAFALAKEGLQKIFDQGLEALANDQLQREFLTYSAIVLLSADSCPSELKADLSSFRGNLPEETSAFIQARNELKVASDLAASITLKKFVLQQESSKYTDAKKEILASEEKIANLNATLATEQSKKAKFDEVLDSIETRVTSAKDGLLSDLAQVSGMEGTVQAANQLVSQRQSVWNSLRTTFTKFA